MWTCEVCNAIYPDDWQQPIHCKHRFPGRDFSSLPKPMQQNLTPVNHWHLIHSRYAEAIKNPKTWDEREEKRHFADWLKRSPAGSQSVGGGCGGCGKKLPSAIAAVKVDHFSPESAFKTTWELHNHISAHHVSPPNPSITYQQCRAVYLGDPLPGRNCIATLAVGREANETLALTRESISRYAAKIGADCIELRGRTANWWGLEKFRMRNIVAAYDRSIFLDCDLIIREDCPDLFEIVSPSEVGIHDDWPFLDQTDWLQAERKSVYDSQGVRGYFGPNCLNTGVVVCSRSHADIWAPPPLQPFPTSHCAEQIWIENSIVGKFGIHPLATKFNTQFWMKDFSSLLPAAKIIHFANAPHKPTAIKEVLTKFAPQ
jgi:hypothetical protein